MGIRRVNLGSWPGRIVSLDERRISCFLLANLIKAVELVSCLEGRSCSVFRLASNPSRRWSLKLTDDRYESNNMISHKRYLGALLIELHVQNLRHLDYSSILSSKRTNCYFRTLPYQHDPERKHEFLHALRERYVRHHSNTPWPSQLPCRTREDMDHRMMGKYTCCRALHLPVMKGKIYKRC